MEAITQDANASDAGRKFHELMRLRSTVTKLKERPKCGGGKDLIANLTTQAYL